MTNKSLREEVSKGLLDIQAVFLRPEKPFTWASGIKSPIYTDNRLILSYPKLRSKVESALAEIIKEKFPKVEGLMGTATAGIAHAALVSDILQLPMGYVRSSSKDHGRNNKIEGKLYKGEKIVVVEDLVSTGGSLLEVVNSLREEGADVLGAVSIFTYKMDKSKKAFEEADLTFYSLTDFDSIIDIAAQLEYIREEDKDKLIAFRDNPSDESWIHA